jgi:hypothetical protein
VDVRSVYNHEAAPVPGAPKVHETQPHEQGHHHHEHEHSSAVAKGSKEDPQHICDEHNHSHDHSHDHGHSRSHDHSHNHSHDHSHSRAHSHDHQSSVSESMRYMQSYTSTTDKSTPIYVVYGSVSINIV